jgi:hypothetical protein
MPHAFPQAILMQVVAHTLAQSGCQSYSGRVLTILVDLMERLLVKLGSQCTMGAELSGRTHIQLKDVHVLLHEFHIDPFNLLEFVYAGWTCKILSSDTNLEFDSIPILPVPLLESKEVDEMKLKGDDLEELQGNVQKSNGTS